MIWSYPMPTIILYGDSHITHLQEWINISILSKVDYKPTPLDKRAVKEAHFCAVGGFITE